MMRLFSRLRLTAALMICPELRVHSGPEAAKAMGLPCDWLQFGAVGGAVGPIENGPVGFFSNEEAIASFFGKRAGITRAVQVDSAVPASCPNEFSEPKPWEGILDQAGAKAWLLAAPEAELRAMAAHLLADKPLSQTEVEVQQLVLLALGASEAISRRVIGAMRSAPAEKSRWSSPVPSEGGRA